MDLITVCFQVMLAQTLPPVHFIAGVYILKDALQLHPWLEFTL